MEPALISGFCNVKRMRVFDSPWTGHRRLAPSRSWDSLTYPGRMESWVSLSGKEDRTNIQISEELGSNWGPLSRKAEILQLCQLCPPCCTVSLTLSVPVVFLNSPNLSPYFSLNKFERIWLLMFSSWLCLINSHFLITKCHILYVLYNGRSWLLISDWHWKG